MLYLDKPNTDAFHRSKEPRTQSQFYPTSLSRSQKHHHHQRSPSKSRVGDVDMPPSIKHTNQNPGGGGPAKIVPLLSLKAPDHRSKAESPSLPDSGIQSPLVAMGDLIKDRWKVLRKIGGGGFGDIYEALDLNDDDHRSVAVKIEPVPESAGTADNDAINPPLVCKQVLKMEVFVLKRLQGRPNFCRLFGCGRNDRFSYLIMSLRGRNLANLRRVRPRVSFTPATVANLGLQMLTAVRDIHAAGFLHRDIKPSNFAVAADPTQTPEVAIHDRLIYALDFGLARQYLDSSGKVRAPRSAAGFRGTVRYASVNAHLNRDLSRRDDIWSLFYVLVEFVMGYLPWRKVRDKERVGTMKMAFDFSHLLEQHSHPELRRFHAHLTSLDSFYDVPDYDHLRSLLLEWRNRVGATEDTPYDWEYQNLKGTGSGSAPTNNNDNQTNINCESTNARSPLLLRPDNDNAALTSYQQSAAIHSTTNNNGASSRAPNFSSTFVAIKQAADGAASRGGKTDRTAPTGQSRRRFFSQAANAAYRDHHRNYYYYVDRDTSNGGTYERYGDGVPDPVTPPAKCHANLSESFPHDYESLFAKAPPPPRTTKARSMPPDPRTFIQFDPRPIEADAAQTDLSHPSPYPKLMAYNYVINNAWTSAKISGANRNKPTSAPPFVSERCGESRFKLFKGAAASSNVGSEGLLLKVGDTYPQHSLHASQKNKQLLSTTGVDSGKGDSSPQSAASSEAPVKGDGSTRACSHVTLLPLTHRRQQSPKRPKHCSHSRASLYEEVRSRDLLVAPYVHGEPCLVDRNQVPGQDLSPLPLFTPPHEATERYPVEEEVKANDDDDSSVGIDQDWRHVTIDPYPNYHHRSSHSLYKSRQRRGPRATQIPFPSTLEALDPPMPAEGSAPAVVDILPASPVGPRIRTKSSDIAEKLLLFSRPPPANLPKRSFGINLPSNSSASIFRNLRRSKSFYNPAP